MSDAYLRAMFARAVTMLAVLAIAVVTTLTSAHAARVGAAPDHAVHVTEMMQVSHGGEASCDDARHCGSVDAGMCEFVCTGLSIFLPFVSGDAGFDCSPVGHDRPAERAHVSRTPGLNEQPPKPRLL